MGKRSKRATAAEQPAMEEQPAAEEPAVELEEPPAEQKNQQQDKKWARLKKRAGYCGLCRDVLRDYTSHASRRPKCKQHPDSRALNEEEWEQLEIEYQEEEIDPAGARERRVAVAKARQAQAWRPPEGPADEIEYRMNFGKHSAGKGLTIKEVLLLFFFVVGAKSIRDKMLLFFGGEQKYP